MDLCTKLQKLHTKEITDFAAADALRLATWGGARALGWGGEAGSLEVGKRADLVLLNLDYPHLQPVNDLVAQMVFSAQGCEVSTTVCEGKVLFHRGKFTTLDEKKIYAKAERWRKKIRKVLESRK
jgi:5-methylthioadenosine/S-adenosylhomocysteine deaminase